MMRELIFFSSTKMKIPTVMKAMQSETGPAIKIARTGSMPIMPGRVAGRMNNIGTRKRICLVRDRMMDLVGCPVAWK